MDHFVAGTTARCAAGLVDVKFKTAAFYYHRLRMLICLATENESNFAGDIEVDESYFGGHRKGKKGFYQEEEKAARVFKENLV